MPLTNGNSKLGKSIWNFNISRSSCDGIRTVECDKYCYARKGNFLFSAVKKSMTRNLKSTKLETFVDKTVAQIDDKDIRYVRLHACGEFYSQQYYDRWRRIAERCPNTKFLAYTRNTIIDFSNRPSNFTIYNSTDKSTVSLNTTLEKRANVFDNPTKRHFTHMERTEHGFACDSKCKVCKACFSGLSPIAFPRR